MAEVLLFHHAMGQTAGFHAFADVLRQAGHTVHTPDLFDGKTFASIEDGMAHVEHRGFLHFIDRGTAAAQGLPDDLVYIGFSLGVVPAQKLAQTRPGARGAVLCYSFVPAGEFGSWPDGLPAQVHAMDADPYFTEEGDLENARDVIAAGAPVELFLYPGDQHYFADESLPTYVPEAAELLTGRVLAFLAGR
ncbi:MAG TPA: dienelactone hydrolase family protein [Propionicimonas sp.]|nr:dienelactone hydrolase family protein [Propionicimonas sp.]